MTTKAGKKRLPRFQRAALYNAPVFRLTERDLKILHAVMQYRVLTTAQIRRLFFGFTNKSSQCDNRLRGLYHHGFLERRQQPALHVGDNKALMYSLTARGVRLVIEQMDVSGAAFRWAGMQNSFQSLYLDHLLRINDMRIALAQGCQLLRFASGSWISEQTIRRELFKTAKSSQSAEQTPSLQVIPDGVFTFSAGGSTHTLFIELDQGTETLEKLQQKLQHYLSDHEAGQLTKRFGNNTLRVLVVTSTKRRLKTILQKMKSLAARQHFAFTCQPLTTPENVLSSPIWYQPECPKPITLFGSHKLIEAYIQQGKGLSPEKVTHVFSDWWNAHEFQKVAITYDDTITSTDSDVRNLAMFLALGKWSGDQLVAMSYRFEKANQVVVTNAQLLSQEQSLELRSRLYE